MQFCELHLGIGKHPTPISSSLFYHCEALGLSSDRPEYALAWFQLCYSGSKSVQGLQIRCYLDSALLGMSGFFTPPEARPSRPAHLHPEVAELGGMQEKRRTRRSRVKLAQNATRIFSRCREGPLSGWQSVWPIWRESWPKCRHRTVAEGGCKWWMEAVRCSNCVQVIDPAPPLFSHFPPAVPCTPSLLCSCPTHKRKHQQRNVSSESWQPPCLGYSSYVAVATPHVLWMRIMNLWVQPYKRITVPVKKYPIPFTTCYI